MADLDLDNSDERLVRGVAQILRDNVDGWAVSSEYGVDNVWPTHPPTSVEDELPRAVIDVISGEDTDLSVDLDVSLREVTVRVTVFTESQEGVYSLVDDSEDAIVDFWDSTDSGGENYTGDWTYREVDGFAETNESEGTEGNLRYSRYRDVIFECVKAN